LATDAEEEAKRSGTHVMVTPGIGVKQIYAPEIDGDGETQYDERVDTWNAGVLLYMLLTGD
jgi:hypothetical protein